MALCLLISLVDKIKITFNNMIKIFKFKNIIGQKSAITSKKAFTLIELLVVVAIISLMSALVLNSIASARMRANDTKIAEDLRSFRKAAELYYNDNRVYPATDSSAMNNQNETVLAANNVQKSSWAHKLAFFVKTAEAAITHTTPLCKNFDNAATAMVSRKYLATVPVHPYDNDATGVCYKAVRSASGNTFSGYGELTTQVDLVGGPTSKMSKRSGFVTGDISGTGIQGLVDYTSGLNASVPGSADDEIIYPAGPDGYSPLDSLGNIVTVDSVDGITNGPGNVSNGIPTGCGAGYFYNRNTSSCVPRVGCFPDIGVYYDGTTNTCKIICPTGYHQVSQFPAFPCAINGSVVVENTYELCHDGIDNDNIDGTDMADPKCANAGTIPPPLELE